MTREPLSTICHDITTWFKVSPPKTQPVIDTPRMFAYHLDHGGDPIALLKVAHQHLVQHPPVSLHAETGLAQLEEAIKSLETPRP